jgi:hypothetical protein
VEEAIDEVITTMLRDDKDRAAAKDQWASFKSR